ncbi:MAG TPA: hotdog fold thioesterase [Acidobacteriota bacterium]|nr:hotdog fold thioesterase [Acidobacteriota bacterium]
MKKERFREICEEGIPFNRFLGIRVDLLEKGHARLLLPYREEFIGDPRRPALHGGVISTLVDMAGGAAAWSELEEGDRLSTVDMLVDYLLPASRHTLQADAHVVRIGNRVAVVQVTVTQQGRKEIIAQGRAVYNVQRK